MIKSTDYYLETFKTKFYTKNPHIKQKEKAEEQIHVFHIKTKGKHRKKGAYHG
jgi:hypothetical protein